MVDQRRHAPAAVDLLLAYPVEHHIGEVQAWLSQRL